VIHFSSGLRKGSGGAIPIRPSIRPSIRLWSGTADGERLLPIRRYTAAALCAQLRGSVALRATTVALPAATRSHSACAAPQQSMTMRQGAPPQQHERAARRASHTSDDPIAIFRLASGHATSQLRPEGKGEWKGRLRAGSECGGVQSKRLPIRKPVSHSLQGGPRTKKGERRAIYRQDLAGNAGNRARPPPRAAKLRPRAQLGHVHAQSMGHVHAQLSGVGARVAPRRHSVCNLTSLLLPSGAHALGEGLAEEAHTAYMSKRAAR